MILLLPFFGHLLHDLARQCPLWQGDEVDISSDVLLQLDPTLVLGISKLFHEQPGRVQAACVMADGGAFG